MSLLGGIAAMPMYSPLRARAQQPGKMRHVGVLQGGLARGDAGGQAEAAAFEDGLKELGWRPGVTIDLDYRWPGAELEAVRTAADAIAATRPDVVVSRSTPATSAMIDSGVPLVFVLVVDPIGSRFVQNFAHPGGNVTGFSSFEGSVGGKWLELLKEASPTLSQVAILFNPETAPFAEEFLESAQTAAKTLRATVIAAPCHNTADIESAFTARAHATGGGIIAITDTFLTEHHDLINELATRYRLPVISGGRVFVLSGGLIAYAVDFADIYRRAAGYVDRILHGTRPGELPVQEPAKFTLSINLKAARAIGLTLPQTLVAQADEVIE